MIKLNKRQKYIKEKYFRIKNNNPLYYCFVKDEELNLSSLTLVWIVNLIIKILEEEYDGDINWGKIT